MYKLYPIVTTVSSEPNTICQELEEEVFEYPFFNEGVVASKIRKKQCPLSSIEVTKQEDDLVLKGIIFNVSHCGSTLLSRMLGGIKSVRVVSEPESINGLFLSKKLYSIKEEKIIDQLKTIISLYQQKEGDKTDLVLKLTSWNIFDMPIFLQAFPGVKWIFLDRNTDDLMASLMRSEGGFIDWWKHPVDELRKHFLEKPESIGDKKDYLLEMIKGHRRFANDNKGKESLFVNYPDFLENYEAIFDHFDIATTENELQTITEVLKFDAKSKKQKIWTSK